MTGCSIIVENFILFDESKPGATRKVVARNHQVLGVNLAVASVVNQESIKAEIPREERLRHRVVESPVGANCTEIAEQKIGDQESALAEDCCHPSFPRGR
jgi:type I restriction enzyme R subunit